MENMSKLIKSKENESRNKNLWAKKSSAPDGFTNNTKEKQSKTIAAEKAFDQIQQTRDKNTQHTRKRRNISQHDKGHLEKTHS